jgi:hypothetical protein
MVSCGREAAILIALLGLLAIVSALFRGVKLAPVVIAPEFGDDRTS